MKIFTIFCGNSELCSYFTGGQRNNETLAKILQFVTGADDEPVMAYILHPAIEFSDEENGKHTLQFVCMYLFMYICIYVRMYVCTLRRTKAAQ